MKTILDYVNELQEHELVVSVELVESYENPKTQTLIYRLDCTLNNDNVISTYGNSIELRIYISAIIATLEGMYN